jgi:hypothetical protein
MNLNVDDRLLWQRRQRWSSSFVLLIFLQAVFICLFVVRLIHLYRYDAIGFEIAVSFGLIYFPLLLILLMFTVALTLRCWIMKRQYDREWRNRGHAG